MRIVPKLRIYIFETLYYILSVGDLQMNSVKDKLTFGDRDEFERRGIAEKVIGLLTSGIDVSPMVIDGGWGIGKTEFCHKLISLLEEEVDHPEIIYIDAFKADHADEPLLTILAAVAELLSPDKQSKFIKTIIPTLKFGLKTSGKALVSHLLKQDSSDVLNDFDEVIQKVADKAIDASVEATLKDHIKADENLEALQKALRQIITDGKPIVIFIDELDRCRPDFAVNMLEVIKHTFDIEELQFVLVTNTEQLKAAVNHRYGQAIDASRYLDKFHKFKFALAETINISHVHINNSITHYKKLTSESRLLQPLKLSSSGYMELVEAVFDSQNISLRETETFVRNMEIYQSLTNQNTLTAQSYYLQSLSHIFALLLFSFRPELSKTILRRSADAKLLGEFLGETTILTSNNGHIRPDAQHVLLVAIGGACKYNSGLFSPKTEGDIKDWEETISSYSSQRLGLGGNSTLGIVITALKVMSLLEN